MKKKLTQERLKEILDYNPETGYFIWKIYIPGSSGIGEIAGNIRADGYIRIRVVGKLRYAHRLAWLYIYGYTPENEIDHIDRNRSNNKINNLRHVSKRCNVRNCGKTVRNKTGVVGVSWYKPSSKWRASIRHDGKVLNLGHFKSFHNAVLARLYAERKYGYSGCCIESTAYQYLQNKQAITNEPLPQKPPNTRQALSNMDKATTMPCMLENPLPSAPPPDSGQCRDRDQAGGLLLCAALPFASPRIAQDRS